MKRVDARPFNRFSVAALRSHPRAQQPLTSICAVNSTVCDPQGFRLRIDLIVEDDGAFRSKTTSPVQPHFPFPGKESRRTGG